MLRILLPYIKISSTSSFTCVLRNRSRRNTPLVPRRHAIHNPAAHSSSTFLLLNVSHLRRTYQDLPHLLRVFLACFTPYPPALRPLRLLCTSHSHRTFLPVWQAACGYARRLPRLPRANVKTAWTRVASSSNVWLVPQPPTSIGWFLPQQHRSFPQSTWLLLQEHGSFCNLHG